VDSADVDSRKTVFVLNFEWTANERVTPAEMEEIASAMRALPGVTPLYSEMAERDYRRRPSIPIAALFSDEKPRQPSSSA
jgi:hypothetical protein